MFPNDTPGGDSLLRKAIRSTGLKICRISSEVKNLGNSQVVDVSDPDSGSEYKDVPILRPDGAFISLPFKKVEEAQDVLRHGTSVLLGFLEGSRAPVVLGVLSTGLGGAFARPIEQNKKTGDKKTDNAVPNLYEGDTGLTNPQTGSLFAIRSDDGDVSIVVFDIDKNAFNLAQNQAEKNTIVQEALSRSPNFDVFLYGAFGSARFLRNPNPNFVNAPQNIDTERVLNARYWGMYKNLVEYPYIASLAYRIRALEDRSSALEQFMKAFQTALSGNFIAGVPALLTAMKDLMKVLSGNLNGQTVRRQLYQGFDQDKGLLSALFVREQGEDSFLPLVYYQEIAKMAGIAVATMSDEDDIDRPFGFGGSNQIGPLKIPIENSVKDIFIEALKDVELAPGVTFGDFETAAPQMKDTINLILNQLDFDFSDTFPSIGGPVAWESLMSSLLNLGLSYQGKATDSHFGIVEE